MGRAPCCNKVGVKKGPWTPEEDIILVSYIQQHGPGNWRSVPNNIGLLRCSKSCRLRWTNYLRPGIKRGHFTDHEEKMIVHLQALLGNKWAAIASYLPQRTDNDIKNYWNTHLKKKLKKLHTGQLEHQNLNQICKGQWERRLQTDVQMAKQALREALTLSKTNHTLIESNPFVLSQSNQQSSSYPSSAENIARLLKSWMKTSPLSNQTTNNQDQPFHSPFGFNFLTSDSSVSSNPTLETAFLQDKNKSAMETVQIPLTTLLEKWIFGDDQAHSHEDLNFSLGERLFD